MHVKQLTVLIFGGRLLEPLRCYEWLNGNAYREISDVFPGHHCIIKKIVHGGARGADHSGTLFGISSGITVTVHAADWDIHGAKAGFIRNRAMMLKELPDVGIGFPGGAGTAHMMKQLQGAGIPVIEVTGDFGSTRPDQPFIRAPHYRNTDR